MQTDTPQPGEREVSGSVRHLMAELYGRPETRASLASVGNLLLLGDEIITLLHDVRTLTRELAEARAEVERLREVLAERGEHADDCGAHYHGYEPSPLAIAGGCTCGLSAALAPAQERT